MELDLSDVEIAELEDRSLVAKIRSICARELDITYSYPFFNCHYLEGEAPDAALLRMLREERASGNDDSIDEIVKVWCHG